MEWALEPHWYLVLVAVAFAAGWLDAIAGGGGLIALPALLLAGVPPLGALATNKLQGAVGAMTAAVSYAREGWVDLRWAAGLIVASFLGASAGTWLVQGMDTSVVERLLPLLLAVMVLYFALSPRLSDLESAPRMGRWAYGLTAAPGIAFYDGFFGPGTGSFFTASAVALLGASARRAVALTKVLNVTSNIASLALFVAGGHILWGVGAAMVVGQLAGAILGARMAIRGGVALIRPLVILSCLAMLTRLLWEQYL
ncbi:TSUP family transporter [Arhodomonas sp. SL1]|uniref:TSUP family transporter n=1 Tax=Arhodomonas sp. SL1 TaxID=3425691 RepID=UPI003F8807D6